MDWPESVPYFTEDDVHNIDGEYEIIENGQLKRCAMGWLKHLFLDFDEFGPLDMKILKEASSIFRSAAQIPKGEMIEEWNDKQTRKRIADVLNKTMKELEYEVEK
uniref:Uncharacterized protein n=1 Tax=viral metagenome TaxID=1070528 RepID=A0A6M3LET0_9ZZZZ